MFTQYTKYRLGMVFVVFFFLIVSIIVSPALAEGETEPAPPTVNFVQEGELTFGPPLPSMINLVLNIKDMGDEYADLRIQVINVINKEGKNLNVDFIQAFPCEHAEKKVQINVKDQVLIREICLNPENLEWGTYTVLIRATLGDLAQATKSIKLIAGPKIPVSIQDSNITVLGTICPKFARENIFRIVLCPTFDENDARTVGGTNIITITGYPANDPERFKKYIQNASGTLVSTDGAGRILVRLNEKTGFTTCEYQTNSMTCSETRLAFWGSIDAGTYSGTFYLNPEDRSNEATKVEISFKAKDYWILPALVILLGLAVSAWVTWKLGPQKEKAARQKADKAIREKRGDLEASLDEFRRLVKKEKGAYFVEDPDILTEVELLLQASDEDSKNELTMIGLSELEEQMTRIVPLFVRFWSFYRVLHELHVWQDTHQVKFNTTDLAKEIEKARQEMWTADTEEKMDSAQDVLTRALLIAHDVYRSNKNKLVPKKPPVFKIIQPSFQETKSATPEENIQKEEVWDWFKPEKIIQWFIVLLSGIYVVYVTNQTFGTPQDYIYAFLWGSTTNAGIEFAKKFFGVNDSIMSAISGIGK